MPPKKLSLADQIKSAKTVAPKVVWKRQSEVLLQPQIPKPMHGLAPRTVLGDKWWTKEKDKACRSTDQHCIACGVYKYNAAYHPWLEAHEQYEISYVLGWMKYLSAIPLCYSCHNFIHCGRMNALLDKGEITLTKHNAIMDHGNRVLESAGLVKPEPYTGPCAAWSCWVLIVNGLEYPPKYQNYAEWLKAFGH